MNIFNSISSNFFKKLPEFPVLLRMAGLAGLFILPTLSQGAAQAKEQSAELPSFWETMDKQAYDEFKKNHIEAAEDLFEDPAWHGVTLYKLGRYKEAINEFKRVKTALGYYNLGNSYAQIGEFEQARKAYQNALKQHPKAELKAKIQHNLAIIEKLLQQKSQPKQQPKSPAKPQSLQPQNSPEEKTPNAPKQPKPEQQPNSQPNASGKENSKQSKKQGGNQSQQSNQQGTNGSKSEEKGGEKAGKTGNKKGKPQKADNTSGSTAHDQNDAVKGADTSKQNEALKLGKKVDQAPNHPNGAQLAKEGQLKQQALKEEEKKQAQQTWLNQIPDDPGLFIQRKFEYQYQNQKPQSAPQKTDKIW